MRRASALTPADSSISSGTKKPMHTFLTLRKQCDDSGELYSFKHGTISDATQGNCSSATTAAALSLSEGVPLSERQVGQCLLVTDLQCIQVYQNLWPHCLYIRHHRTPRTHTEDVVYCATEYCNLWMTDVTLQGDGSKDPSWGGMSVIGGQVYAKGGTPAVFPSLYLSTHQQALICRLTCWQSEFCCFEILYMHRTFWTDLMTHNILYCWYRTGSSD